MNVLAITAHPDDAEIFMYGLLSLLKKQGHNISILIVTDGALGGNETGAKLAKPPLVLRVDDQN